MKTQRSSRIGRGWYFFFLLFGLPFLAVGIGATWKTFDLLNDYYRARRWVETPAFINSVELKANSDGDSSTYHVVCRYRYTYEGRPYDGHRVGLMGGSDNVGDWHKRIHARLEEASRNETAVPCYVNPRNPAEAVLDRELRFPMLAFITIFATVFTCVGGGMCAGSALAWRAASRDGALAADHPDEPWLHRADWASGLLSPRLSRTEVIAWICAIFWNAVSGPLLIFLPHEVFVRRNYLALLALLFTAVGLSLLVWAIRATASRKKFGQSYVELDRVPGVIGGYLRGRLVLTGQLEGLDHARIELNCTHTYTTGSGDNRTTHNDVIWADTMERDVATRFGQTTIELPFDFQIPYECRATQPAGSDTITWKLVASAAVPGVDLRLNFEVPVFQTPESNPKIQDTDREAREEAAISSEQDPLPGQIQIGVDDAGHTQYTVPCWPGVGMFIGYLLMDAGFSGFAVFAWSQRAHGGCFLWGFAIVFGLIGLALTLGLPGQFGRLRLTLIPSALRVERQLGPYRRTRTIDAAQIAGVETQKGVSSGSKQWFQVTCRVGKSRITLARNIPGPLAARWLVRRIEEHVSRPASPEALPSQSVSS